MACSNVNKEVRGRPLVMIWGWGRRKSRKKLHTRNAKVSPIDEGCPIKRTYTRGEGFFRTTMVIF